MRLCASSIDGKNFDHLSVPEFLSDRLGQAMQVW
jgi:hypothetical protein